MGKIIFTRCAEREDDSPRLPKNICPECKVEMRFFKDEFICLKCGLKLK